MRRAQLPRRHRSAEEAASGKAELGRNAPHSPNRGLRPALHTWLPSPAAGSQAVGKKPSHPAELMMVGSCFFQKPTRLLSSSPVLSAPVHKSSSSCPFTRDQRLLPSTTASPGNHGGCIHSPGWGFRHLPCTFQQGTPSLPSSRQTPGCPSQTAQLHRGSEKRRCAFSSDSFSAFPFLFFFFLKAQPCTP